MDKAQHDDAARPPWSVGGLIQGARLITPVLPGVFLYATAFGTVAAQKGLTLWQAETMSGLVYAGAAQLVAMQVWPDHFTTAAILALVAVTATVNARLLLMGAALRPWLGHLPAWQAYPTLYLMTDSTFLVIMRRRGEAAMPALFLGSGIAMWFTWIIGALPGYLLGSTLPEPQRFGLDLVFPAFFSAMLVPLWRGRRRALPWVVSGAVAIAVNRLFPGWWFIIAGSIAGSVTGGFVHERE